MNLSKRSLRKRHKNLSIFILLCFLLSQFSGDATRAFAQSEVVYDQINLQSQTPSLFQGLPQQIGTVKKVWRPAHSTAPFVVIIQDAHANPEAQNNIKKLLEWFREKNRSNKSSDGKTQPLHIALENLSGTLHPEYFNFFPAVPEANERAIDDLAAKGELTGPELFTWEMYRAENKIPEDIRIQGVENPALYKQNLRIFRSLLFQEEPIKKDLEAVEIQLNKSAGLLLSKDLFDFLKEKQKRKDGQYGPSGNNVSEDGAQLGVYLHFLETLAAEKLKIDLNDKIEQIRFPGLARWKAAESLDKEIARDPNRYRSAWQHLFESLVKSASPEDKSFLQASFSSWATNPEARNIAENFLKLIQKYSPPSGDMPDAVKLLERWVLASEITPDLIMDEMHSLETALIGFLAKTETDKKLMALLDDFSIYRDCLLLKLAERDFESMNSQKLVFSGKSWKNRLEQDGKIKIEQDELSRLDSRMKNAVRFYQGAKKRDAYLIEKTVRQSEGSRFSVLVAGGFHAAGMAEKLEEKNIPYALIQPAITKSEGSQLYASVMKGLNAKLPDGLNNDFFTIQQALILKSLIEVAIPEALRRFPEKKEFIFDGVKNFSANPNIFISDLALSVSNRSAMGMDISIHYGNTTVTSNSVFRPPLMGDAAEFSGVLPTVISRARFPGDAHYRFHIAASGEIHLDSRAEIRAIDSGSFRSGRPRHRQVVNFKYREGVGPNAPVREIPIEIALGGNRSLDFRLASEEYKRGSKTLRRGPSPVTPLRHFFNQNQLNRNIGQGYFFSGQLNNSEYGDGAVISGFDNQLPVLVADLNQRRGRILSGNKIQKIGPGPAAVQQKLSEMKTSIEAQHEDLPAYFAFHIDDVLLKKRGHRKTGNGRYEPEVFDKDRQQLLDLLIWFIQKDVPIAFLSNNDSEVIQELFLEPLRKALAERNIERTLPIYFYTNGLTNHGLIEREDGRWVIEPHVADEYNAGVRIPKAAIDAIRGILGEVTVDDNDGHVRLGSSGLLPKYYRTLATHNGVHFAPSADLVASFPDLAFETTKAGDMAPPEVQISQGLGEQLSGDADMISIRHLISYASAANGDHETAARINLGESEYDPRERLLAAIAAELIEFSDNAAAKQLAAEAVPETPAEKKASETFGLDLSLLLGASIDDHTTITEQIIFNLRKLFGVEDLITSQLPAGLPVNEGQKQKAAERMLKAIKAMQKELTARKTAKQIFNLETLERRDFLAHFGTQSLFRVSTDDVRFSTIIPRSFARGKLTKPDTAYALSGYYKSPGTQPIVILNNRVLGHLLKAEYIKSVDPVKMIFEFTADIPIKGDQENSEPAMIDPHFLDINKVYHYLGIPPAYMPDGTSHMNAVFFYNKTNKGDGEELAAVAHVIKSGLPHQPKVKYLQRARTDHPTVALDTYSNVSFMTYLELLGSSVDYPEKPSKAITALQPVRLNAKGEPEGQTIPFYDIGGELLGLFDWSKIPHGDAVLYDPEKYTPKKDYVYQKFSLRGRLEAVTNEIDALNLKFKMRQIESDVYQRELQAFFEKNRVFFSAEGKLHTFTELNGIIPGTVSYVEKQLQALRTALAQHEMGAEVFLQHLEDLRRENPLFVISTDGYLLTRELILESIAKAARGDASEADRKFLSTHFRVREGTHEFLVATKFNSFDLDSLSQIDVVTENSDPHLTTSFIELMGLMRHQVEVIDYLEPIPQQVRTIADHSNFETALLAQDPFQRSLPSMNARNNAVESITERLKQQIVDYTDESPNNYNSAILQRLIIVTLSKSIDPGSSSLESLDTLEAIIRSLLAESYNQSWQYPLIEFLLDLVESDGAQEGLSGIWENIGHDELLGSIMKFRIRALLAESIDTGTLATQAQDGYLTVPRYATILARLKNYFSKIHNAAAEGAQLPTDYILERLADTVTENIYRAPQQTIEDHLRLRNDVFGYSDLETQINPELSVVHDRQTPVDKIFAFTGGTLLQAAYAKAFASMGLFDPELVFGGFYSYVANTDDGGHSYAIVKSFIEATYGVLVALGDIGNSLSGFVTPDKRAYYMGNDGRIPEDSKSTLFTDAVRPNIWKTIADPAVSEMEPDFFMFGRAVIDLMNELDKLNQQMERSGKKPLAIPKSSLRNLFSAALLFHEGLIRRRSNAETPMISTDEEIRKFEEAIQKYTALLGAHHYHGSVTSFDPKTLFALYEGYTLRLKDKNGRIETLVLTPKYDETGKVIIGLNVKNPQPVSKIIITGQPGNAAAGMPESVAFSRKRTAVSLDLNSGQSVRVDDDRLETGFTETPIEISVRDGHIKLQIENQSFTLTQDDKSKGYNLVKSEPGAERPYKLVETAPVENASPLNYVYLRSDDGVAENNIFLSTDGTGRRAEWGGITPNKKDVAEMAKQAMFTLQNGTRVNLMGRVVKSQSFITEVPHDSTITHVGLLDQGRGAKGVVPELGENISLSSNPLMIEELKKNKETGKRDLVFFGPGSPLTSLSPIFLVKGLAETLVEKKKRGDKIVLVLNSTYDNESANWKPFDVLRHFQEAITRHSPGLKLEDIFTDIIVLEKDQRIPANILTRLDELTDTTKRGDPNLSDYKVDQIAFNILASELSPELEGEKKENFVKLLLALYPRSEPEERFDPAAPSHSAKKARGAMGFSEQDFKEEIAARVTDSETRTQQQEAFSAQHLWRNMQVHFLPPSALVVQLEKARVPGEKEYRAVFKPEALAGAFKDILESPSPVRNELRIVSRAPMPTLNVGTSSELLRGNLSNWLQTPEISRVPAILLPPSLSGIYRPYQDLARSESVSDAEALAAVVRALLNPSIKQTSVGKNILKTAKESLGEFGFLLDRLSEQPVHLGGVIGDSVLNRDSEDFANLLILLELASQEKFSVTYLVSDNDGKPGIDLAPFSNRLRTLSASWGISPDDAAKQLRFLPLSNSDAKGIVVRTLNQDFSNPAFKDSAKGVLHESLDLLRQFGYQKTLARIHQGDINYETAILVSASLLREKIGEASATASIWNLHDKIQQLGGIEALVSRVASMIANIRKVSQAA